MAKYDPTPDDLAREAAAAADLVKYLQEAHEDDEDLVSDMIEGETEFKEAIGRALEQVNDAEMMVDAITHRIDDLKARKDRFADRAQFLRHLITMALVHANGDRPLPFSLPLPEGTVTARDGGQKLTVDDEAAVASEFWKPGKPTLDRAALRELWRDTGLPPAGCSVIDAAPTLTIRKK